MANHHTKGSGSQPEYPTLGLRRSSSAHPNPSDGLGINGSRREPVQQSNPSVKPDKRTTRNYDRPSWIRKKWDEAKARRHSYIREERHGCLSALMYFAFILGVSMILSTVAILGANDVFAFVKPDVTVVVDLPEEATTEQVAALLAEEGVVNYPKLFELYVQVAKSGITYKTGKVEVDASLDYSALISTLRYREPGKTMETVRVTIPEGYTTEQIVSLLVESGVCTEEALWAEIINGVYDYEFLAGRENNTCRMEGYLFPDTYEFYLNSSASEVIGKLLKTFSKRFSAGLQKVAKEKGLTIDQVVIIASLIEKEAQLDDERARVSSVIFNRLHSSDYPYLQIDATVQYITGRAPTPEDLTIDDPYNTYLYEGLPPTAIANPGLDSLQAALYPEETGYFYYVAKGDGSHIFSATLAEHQAAIASLGG